MLEVTARSVILIDVNSRDAADLPGALNTHVKTIGLSSVSAAFKRVFID